MASVATGLAGTGGMNLLFSGQLMAQSILTPDEAIKQLLAGNERFDNDNLSSLKEDLKILRDNTVEKQEPFAAVLACADSRVPVEMIFDQTIGRIFVTRVAGNMVTPEIIASLEYGAAVLGTKVILVLGHSGCGAVKAALAGKEVPGQISALFPHLQPAIDKAGPNLEATTKANAQLQAALLRKSSPLLAPMVKEGKLKIIAGYYDVGSGKVTLIED
jgi:carbonic anhydrase